MVPGKFACICKTGDWDIGNVAKKKDRLNGCKAIYRAFGLGRVARNSYDNLPTSNDMLFSSINIFFQLCVSSH